ncbi:NADP-dependent oxidoreductase [Longispora albida]|uniref:NADP-dependent oxidoreductase n=1 Tax=Longispora albida TaxID=203523 RepID=UPI00036FC646|nr:NADP-dependent oxidoreductase [Longispora albida]
MKAVQATHYGTPEEFVLADLPVPEPGPGQIQVRIAAASVNPGDIRLPSGDFRDVVEVQFPHVPGNDFAGTVTRTGEGVTSYQPGDEVFGFALPRVLRGMAGPGSPSLGTGALAEYAVFEADTPFVTHRPAGLTAEQAAALPTVGLTARALMHYAEIKPGETVLVIGATGGVGTAVVPLLAQAGAHVIATATGEDEKLLAGLGAAETVDYRTADPAEEVLKRRPDGVDVVFNLVLPGDDLAGAGRAARPGGRMFTITFPAPVGGELGRDDVSLQLVLDMAGVAGGMREVAEAAEAGLLPAVIGKRFSLDDGVRALVAFAREHTTGKVVVTMP